MGLVDLILRPLARPRATVGYPKRLADSVTTMRVPRFQPDLCTDDRACLAICPTNAIAIEAAAGGGRRWSLDYGQCIFCAECARVCPSLAIHGTGEFEMAATDRAGVIRHYELGGSASD